MEGGEILLPEDTEVGTGLSAAHCGKLGRAGRRLLQFQVAYHRLMTNKYWCSSVNFGNYQRSFNKTDTAPVMLRSDKAMQLCHLRGYFKNQKQ